MTTFQMTDGSTDFTLDTNDRVFGMSVQASPSGGSFTILGSLPFQTVAPAPLTLSDGQGVNLTIAGFSNPLSLIRVEWVSGVVDVVLSY